MFIYLDHRRYELANSKVDHTQEYCGEWVCELSYYVLGYGNEDSIAHGEKGSLYITLHPDVGQGID